MLSILDTELGLTVVHKGKTLRVVRQSPIYSTCRELLQKAMPCEQAWAMLQELTANPKSAIFRWFASFGFEVVAGTGHRANYIDINKANLSLPCETWEPYFNRIQATGGSPVPALEFARRLGNPVEINPVNACIHWHASATQGFIPKLVYPQYLPENTRPGDLVAKLGYSTAATPAHALFLVSFAEYPVENGTIRPLNGVILQKVDSVDAVQAILSEPVILGNNRTYRCEEGDPSGWLEDVSFDSLAHAKVNLAEIRKSGSDARILNRISNLIVPI